MLPEVKEFYLRVPGVQLWLEQAECVILRHENLLIGFCQRDSADTQGMITFFFDERSQVDVMYQWCKKNNVEITSEPKVNSRYGIYHFFARDIEGRSIEFQYFLSSVEKFW